MNPVCPRCFLEIDCPRCTLVPASGAPDPAGDDALLAEDFEWGEEEAIRERDALARKLDEVKGRVAELEAEAARLRPLGEAVRLWHEAVKRSLAGEDDYSPWLSPFCEDDAEVDGEDGVMRALSHLERVYDALDAAGEATP